MPLLPTRKRKEEATKATRRKIERKPQQNCIATRLGQRTEPYNGPMIKRRGPVASLPFPRARGRAAGSDGRRGRAGSRLHLAGPAACWPRWTRAPWSTASPTRQPLQTNTLAISVHADIEGGSASSLRRAATEKNVRVLLHAWET